MLNAADPELLYASKEPGVAYLSQTFKTTQSDLGEWLDRRQRDYDVRNCQWAGKSDDFKKHSSLNSTGKYSRGMVRATKKSALPTSLSDAG